MAKRLPEPTVPPAVQFIVPFTVSGWLAASVPALKVRLLTVVGALIVTVTPSERVASSEAPGTWLGDQLAAIFQFPPRSLVHTMLAAREARVIRPRKERIRRRWRAADHSPPPPP